MDGETHACPILDSSRNTCPPKTYGDAGWFQDPRKPVAPTVKVASHSSTKEIDISDWRAWANSRPGECACGIPKTACNYHR